MNNLNFPLSKNELLSLQKGGFILYGTLNLVGGVATLENFNIKANSSIAYATYHTPGGTMGSTLRAVCIDGLATFTAREVNVNLSIDFEEKEFSVSTSMVNATLDTSKINYLIIL